MVDRLAHQTPRDLKALLAERDALRAELAQARSEQAATAEVLAAIRRSSLDLSSTLQTLLDTAVRVCGAHFGMLQRIRGDSYLRETVSPPTPPAPLGRTGTVADAIAEGNIFGRVVEQRRLLSWADVQSDLTLGAGTQGAVRSHDVRAFMSVPMFHGDELVGVLELGRNTVLDAFTPAQESLAQSFADQAAIAIENARLVAELQERLDEQTATAEVLASEGTGLGLALVKRYVELHGGVVSVESAPGQGTTFTWSLPARQAATP